MAFGRLRHDSEASLVTWWVLGQNDPKWKETQSQKTKQNNTKVGCALERAATKRESPRKHACCSVAMSLVFKGNAACVFQRWRMDTYTEMTPMAFPSRFSFQVSKLQNCKPAVWEEETPRGVFVYGAPWSEKQEETSLRTMGRPPLREVTAQPRQNTADELWAEGTVARST